MQDYDLKTNNFLSRQDYIDFLSYVSFLLSEEKVKVIPFEYILEKLEYLGITCGRTKKCKTLQILKNEFKQIWLGPLIL